MRVPYQIARRYLFGKKSTNAINIITGISVLGIAIGTASLILILSVFNGFESLTRDFLDKFNPDYKIEATTGKYFEWTPDIEHAIEHADGLVGYSKIIEEVAHFEYNSKQQIGIVKGVDESFLEVTDFHRAIKEGEASFRSERLGPEAVIGNGIYNNLNINLTSKLASLKVSVPNRRRRGTLDRDFKTRSMLVSGVFTIRNEKDNQYVLVDYDLAASLLDLKDQVSAIEINTKDEIDQRAFEAEMAKIFPTDRFKISDRLTQDASALKVMNIEKWSSYLIFSFTLILIIFNVIGCLWMIVLEKKKDLSVLQSFGATKQLVRKIFLYEGGLISLIGFMIGFIFSVVFYILQKTVGIITVPDGYTITNYPMELEAMDVFIIFLTVMFLGLIASLPASKKAASISAYVRME